MTYNATAYKTDSQGRNVSVQAVEVNDNGMVVRAAGYWTYSIGTEAYDADWRNSQFSMVANIRIERDGARGYIERLAGLQGVSEMLEDSVA